MGPHDCIGRVGARQNAVHTRAQARRCGIADSTIDDLVRRGLWRRWFDGAVYSPSGAPETWLTTMTAAWLRVGPGDAVVAGRSAARLWDLPEFDRTDALELVARREHTPIVAGIRVKRTTYLPAADVIWHGVLPVTSVTRTLHDLAAVVDDDLLLPAAADGWRLGRTDPMRLLASLQARPRLAGNRRLRRVIEALDERYARTRSVAEILDLVLLRRHGYGDFDVNVRLALTSQRRVQVDVLFDPNAVLEINGRRYHANVLQRRQDAERRRDLEADGYVCAELWADELHDAERVTSVVDDLLLRAGRGRRRGRSVTVGEDPTVGR